LSGNKRGTKNGFHDVPLPSPGGGVNSYNSPTVQLGIFSHPGKFSRVVRLKSGDNGCEKNENWSLGPAVLELGMFDP